MSHIYKTYICFCLDVLNMKVTVRIFLSGPGDLDRGARCRLWSGQTGRICEKGDHSDQPCSGDNDLGHPGCLGEQLRGRHGRSDFTGIVFFTKVK